MRIDTIAAATAPAEGKPLIGGWTSYCRLAASFCARKAIKEEGKTDHDRGH